MSDMADVLALHQDWQYTKNLGYYRSEYKCTCGGTFWHGDHEEDPSFNQALAAHQAAALSAAGFGPVREARAEAWDEGRKHGSTYPYGQRGLATDDNPYREASDG